MWDYSIGEDWGIKEEDWDISKSNDWVIKEDPWIGQDWI